MDGLLQAPVEQVGLEALDAEHGKPVLAAQPGIVGKGVEFRLGAVAAQEGVEGFVVKTVDAFDLQAGALDDLEAPVETLAAQAAARFPVSWNQRHGDVDAVDSDLFQEAQVFGAFQPVGADAGTDFHGISCGGSRVDSEVRGTQSTKTASVPTQR